MCRRQTVYSCSHDWIEKIECEEELTGLASWFSCCIPRCRCKEVVQFGLSDEACHECLENRRHARVRPSRPVRTVDLSNGVAVGLSCRCADCQGGYEAFEPAPAFPNISSRVQTLATSPASSVISGSLHGSAHSDEPACLAFPDFSGIHASQSRPTSPSRPASSSNSASSKARLSLPIPAVFADEPNSPGDSDAEDPPHWKDVLSQSSLTQSPGSSQFSQYSDYNQEEAPSPRLRRVSVRSFDDLNTANMATDFIGNADRPRSPLSKCSTPPGLPRLRRAKSCDDLHTPIIEDTEEEPRSRRESVSSFDSFGTADTASTASTATAERPPSYVRIRPTRQWASPLPQGVMLFDDVRATYRDGLIRIEDTEEEASGSPNPAGFIRRRLALDLHDLNAAYWAGRVVINAFPGEESCNLFLRDSIPRDNHPRRGRVETLDDQRGESVTGPVVQDVELPRRRAQVMGAQPRDAQSVILEYVTNPIVQDIELPRHRAQVIDAQLIEAHSAIVECSSPPPSPSVFHPESFRSRIEAE